MNFHSLLTFERLQKKKNKKKKIMYVLTFEIVSCSGRETKFRTIINKQETNCDLIFTSKPYNLSK